MPAQGLTNPLDIPQAFQESPKLMLEFDSKRSFLGNRDIKILGARVGMDFDQKIAVGFGAYFLRSPFVRNFITPDDSGGTDTIRSNLKFAYVSIWAEYILLVTKRWEVSIPMTLAFGEASFAGFERQTYTSLILVETSLEAQYKIFPWLGLGAGLGYRQPIAGTRSLRQNFGAPIYRFGVRLFLGYVIKKVLGEDF